MTKLNTYLIFIKDLGSFTCITSKNTHTKNRDFTQILRWYRAPLYCDIPVLPIEIKNEIKCNFINVFFPEIVT